MDDTHLRWDIEVERLNKMTLQELKAEYPDLWNDEMDKIHFVLTIVDFIRYGRVRKKKANAC